MLASWIQQAAFEPPMISVAVRKGRAIEAIIDEAGGFVVNILSDNPGAMFKHFGRGFGLDEEAFAGLATRDAGCGVVIEDRSAWMACRVRGKHDAGDHWIYLGEVVEGDAVEGGRPYVHLRKNGMSY